MNKDFTHFDSKGDAIMVDVSGKADTNRRAVAKGLIKMSAPCYQAVKEGTAKKGDVLGVARVAGILATKRTSDLIPLCHPIQIAGVGIEFALRDETCEIVVECTVKTTGQTGVEMEALTGVSVTLLTIYDMCKAIDKGMEMGSIYLAEKTGGKSGEYRNQR